jgi:hypothetical protein
LVDEQVDLAMTLFGFRDPNGQFVWWECVIEGRQWQRLRQWILRDLELVGELCEEGERAERAERERTSEAVGRQRDGWSGISLNRLRVEGRDCRDLKWEDWWVDTSSCGMEMRWIQRAERPWLERDSLRRENKNPTAIGAPLRDTASDEWHTRSTFVQPGIEFLLCHCQRERQRQRDRDEDEMEGGMEKRIDRTKEFFGSEKFAREVSGEDEGREEKRGRKGGAGPLRALFSFILFFVKRNISFWWKCLKRFREVIWWEVRRREESE